MTQLPTNHWGISPTAPTLPRPQRSIAVTGRTSGIRSPSRRGYLLRARVQGQAWDGGLDRGGGGAAPIHFRTVRDHHCLPSHPVTYYYRTRWLTSCVFLCVRFHKKQFWMCGLGIGVAHAHFTSEHTLSLSRKHTLSIHRHTVITTGASQQTYTSDCEWYSSS